MSDPSLTLREATTADVERIESLLAANDLPTADVRETSGRFFLAHDGGRVVGVGGLEVHGTVGLLRSVVVPEAERGAGYGATLCDTLEARARKAGVETLYLLTTTAADFFADRGYEEISRDAAPRTIRETTEFAELCPTSAVCLRKRLT